MCNTLTPLLWFKNINQPETKEAKAMKEYRLIGYDEKTEIAEVAATITPENVSEILKCGYIPIIAPTEFVRKSWGDCIPNISAALKKQKFI